MLDATLFKKGDSSQKGWDETGRWSRRRESTLKDETARKKKNNLQVTVHRVL